MQGTWEENVPGLPRGRWSRPQATMGPNGNIRITRRTWELMEQPAFVIVLFNITTLTIGLKPIRACIGNAYPVEPFERLGGRIVRAASLVPQSRFRCDRAVRFLDPSIDDDGILILDLKTAYPAARPRPQRLQRPRATEGDLKIKNEYEARLQ